jgi:uncharacterized membrane protein YfbV (UPF0208 family)
MPPESPSVEAQQQKRIARSEVRAMRMSVWALHLMPIVSAGVLVFRSTFVPTSSQYFAQTFIVYLVLAMIWQSLWVAHPESSFLETKRWRFFSLCKVEGVPLLVLNQALDYRLSKDVVERAQLTKDEPKLD